MTHIRLFAAATLIVALLTGCGSDAGLRSPDFEAFMEADSAETREEQINADVLIGLPWREAQQMAHDAGWRTQMTFIAEGQQEIAMTLDNHWDRLRLTVVGGKETGTVAHLNNS